jgi:hypothetical protein
MERLGEWVFGFIRFWYEFIVGDDWTEAAAVLVAIVISAILQANRISPWWLVPLVVIGATGLSLRRASRRSR